MMALRRPVECVNAVHSGSVSRARPLSRRSARTRVSSTATPRSVLSAVPSATRRQSEPSAEPAIEHRSADQLAQEHEVMPRIDDVDQFDPKQTVTCDGRWRLRTETVRKLRAVLALRNDDLRVVVSNARVHEHGRIVQSRRTTYFSEAVYSRQTSQCIAGRFTIPLTVLCSKAAQFKKPPLSGCHGDAAGLLRVEQLLANLFHA